MEKRAYKVLIVDDDPNLRATLRDILKVKGFETLQADTGGAALKLVAQQLIDVVLIDLRLGDMPGMEVLHSIKERSPESECILMTGHASQDSAIEALNLGAYSYILKPFDVNLILLSITHAAERGEAAKALVESEKRYNTFINATTDLAFLKDDQFRYMIVNQANADFIGKPVEEIIGKDDFELLDEKTARAFRMSDERILMENTSITTHETMAGSTYETLKFPVPMQDGRMGVGGYVRDVTEKIRAEQALHESEAHYRGLFEDSPISLWEEDFSQVKMRLDQLRKRGVKDFRAYLKSHPEKAAECISLIRVIDVNKATLELYRAEDKAHFFSSLSISFSDDPESFTEELVQIAEGKTSFNWDGVNHTLDGKQMDIHLGWTVVPGHENDLSKVIISLVDMTERKQSEEALKRSESSLQAVLQSTADGILAIGGGNDVLYANERFAEMWRIPQVILDSKDDSVLLKHVLDQLSDPQSFIKKVEELYNSNEESFDILLFKDGRVFERLSRPLLPGTEKQGRVWSFRDITERKQAETQIRESEARYHKLFDDSPIALCEEDFSAVKKRLDALRRKGIKDIRAYLKSHPNVVMECAGLAKIVDANKATLDLYHAKSKDELLRSLSTFLADETYEVYLEELVHIWDGEARFDWEGVNQTLDGKQIIVNGRWTVTPGYESDLSKVIFSIIDITARKQEEAKTRRHLAELEILYENGLAVSRLLEPAKIGERIIDALAEHLAWHHVAIRLREGDTDNLKVVAFSQTGLKKREQAALEARFNSLISKIGQGIGGWVAQTGEPLRTGNVLAFKQYVDTYPGIQSGLYIPLKIGEHVTGCISVESEQADAFSEQDERLLTTLANQAAVAFENAHLYQAVQEELIERQQIEKALRESEERYRMVTENTTDMVFLMNLELDVVYVSPSVVRATGFTLEELQAIRLERLLAPESIANVTKAATDELASDRLAELELRIIRDLDIEFIRKDGSTFWSENTFVLIRDEQGQPVNILGTGRDITARRLAEDALRESEQRLQSILDNTSAQVYIKDLEGRYILANLALANVLGCPFEEIRGKNLRDLIPLEEAEQHIANDKAVLASGASATFEEIHNMKDGIHTYLSVKFPLRAGNDEIYAIGGISTDITEQKRAEEQLQLLSRAVEQSPASIVLTDAAGNIEYVNPRFSQVSGYQPDEVMGRNPNVLKSGFTPEEEYTNLWRQITSGEEWRGEFRNRKKSGDLFWESAWIAPILDKNGRTTHFLAVKEDITARKGAELFLQRSKVELEEQVTKRTMELSSANAALAKATRLKDEFLASMSHELRTPLTGVLGLTEAMQRQVYGELNPRQGEILHTIEESGRHLLNLINDILDLSKIEAGRMDLEVAKLSVDDLCQASLRLVKQMAGARHQTVGFDVKPSGLIMRADARRLKQVLFNLLGNAIKFTPENGELGLEVRGNPEQREIRFTVWDRGIGISEEDLQRLFQPFVQLDSSLARNYPGTGLGLSLARRLVELHGGRIEVESTKGQGSRFIVILPWVKSDTAPLSLDEREITIPASVLTVDKSRNAKYNILVADDNEVNIQLISDYLTSQGFQVILSRDGFQALEAVSQRRPDLVLMDIQMPGMDGLEAIRRIRSLPDPKLAKLSVIAVTALVMPGDRERCLEAGANYYLTKPLNLGALVEIIQLFLEKAR